MLSFSRLAARSPRSITHLSRWGSINSIRSISCSSAKYATPSDFDVRIPSSHSTEAGRVNNLRTTNISTSAKNNNSGSDHLEKNSVTETNRLEKTLERFWEKVTIGRRSNNDDKDQDNFVILLDDKPIKTPGGNQLVIPNSKPTLAHLIVHEWTILPSLKIKPHLVPLTSLSSRAIDLTYRTENSNQLIDSSILDNITDALLPYLDTDTLLVFSPHQDCEGKLREAQESEYRPLVSFAEEFWTKFSPSSEKVTLNMLDTETMGFSSNQQPEVARAAVTNWIKSLDPWSLVSLERATMSSKSLIIGMLISTNQISVNEAVRAATLETIHQTEVWGEVQDSHDVDFHDIRRTLASAYILATDV